MFCYEDGGGSDSSLDGLEPTFLGIKQPMMNCLFQSNFQMIDRHFRVVHFLGKLEILGILVDHCYLVLGIVGLVVGCLE